MTLPPPDSLERLTHADLIGVVRDLIGEVTRMQAETEKLGGALAKLRVEHQAVKDELARLKHLPPRPPIKPSGMDKSTQAKGPEAGDEKGGRSSRRRGSQLDRLKIGAIIVVKADPPAGSRNKGFEDIVVQDLSLNPQVTRYRRERWETPDGKTIIAALDPGLVGGYGGIGQTSSGYAPNQRQQDFLQQPALIGRTAGGRRSFQRRLLRRLNFWTVPDAAHSRRKTSCASLGRSTALQASPERSARLCAARGFTRQRCRTGGVSVPQAPSKR